MTQAALTPRLRVLACAVAFNEEDRIGSVIDRVQREHVDDLIVLDDGSTDGTPRAASDRGVTVVRHETRKGVGAAIRTAIRYARERGFDVLVIMAGNDKDRPVEIPRLLKPIEWDECDFVQGSRYLPGGDFGNMPFYRRVATQFIHPMLFSMAAGKRITDTTNGFRAFRLSIFDDQRIDIGQAWLDSYELEPYILFKALKLGYRVQEVPVTKIYPPHGQRYTRMTPVVSWWSILRPVFLLGLGLRK